MHPQPTSEENPSPLCPLNNFPAYCKAATGELNRSPLVPPRGRGIGMKSVRYVIHIRDSKSSRNSSGHVLAGSEDGVSVLSGSFLAIVGLYCSPRHQIMDDGSSFLGSGSQK